MMKIRTIGNKVVAHVVFEAGDPEGHRKEVEAVMAWMADMPDKSARAIFEGMDKIDIAAHTDYYRQKAMQAKPKCGAFAFVGLSGLKSVMFNFVIMSAGMPMRMVPTLAEAEAWVVQREVKAEK